MEQEAWWKKDPNKMTVNYANLEDAEFVPKSADEPFFGQKPNLEVDDKLSVAESGILKPRVGIKTDGTLTQPSQMEQDIKVSIPRANGVVKPKNLEN